MSTTVDLPDLNVWLALACPDHSHHRQALHYWEQQAAEQVLFCSVTALGLVRLVGQPKLMGAAVKTAGEASALLEAFCQQPGVRMAATQGTPGRAYCVGGHGERTSKQVVEAICQALPTAA